MGSLLRNIWSVSFTVQFLGKFPLSELLTAEFINTLVPRKRKGGGGRHIFVRHGERREVGESYRWGSALSVCRNRKQRIDEASIIKLNKEAKMTAIFPTALYGAEWQLRKGRYRPCVSVRTVDAISCTPPSVVSSN